MWGVGGRNRRENRVEKFGGSARSVSSAGWWEAVAWREAEAAKDNGNAQPIWKK